MEGFVEFDKGFELAKLLVLIFNLLNALNFEYVKEYCLINN